MLTSTLSGHSCSTSVAATAAAASCSATGGAVEYSTAALCETEAAYGPSRSRTWRVYGSSATPPSKHETLSATTTAPAAR